MRGTAGLEAAVAGILEGLAAKNGAREMALASSRRIIRASANSIRAVHRGDIERGQELLAEARRAHLDVRRDLAEDHADLYYTGFVQDAQKEYAEAATTLALLTGGSVPEPGELEVEATAWLNGIAEAIGELRRWILDRLRAGLDEGCEDALGAMDDIYAVLVTIDYPDAMTGGLRRTTDQARGILERTRGDLTMAIVQRNVITALEDD